eukprot:jgi/Tetstr1/443274/TSEL_031308.t1
MDASVGSEEPRDLSLWKRAEQLCARVSALACLGVAVLVSSPFAASAASSGGRVGGNSFRSNTATAATTTHTHSTTVVHSSPSVIIAPSPMVMAAPVVVAPAPVVPVVAPAYGMAGFMPFGGSFLIVKLLLLGLIAVILIGALTGFLGGSAEEEEDIMGGPCTVVKLQVGLLGLARDLQNDLDRIAQNSDTDTPEGLQSVLQETTLSLLRNPDYCVYGYSEASQTPGMTDAEHKFNQQSLSERSKFSSETLVNYAGQNTAGTSAVTKDASNELIVVTLVAAVAGRLELPKVESLAELKEALSKLGAVPADALMAMELMWTPQQAGDSFSPDQLVLDYPQMNHL